MKFYIFQLENNNRDKIVSRDVVLEHHDHDILLFSMANRFKSRNFPIFLTQNDNMNMTMKKVKVMMWTRICFAI